MAKKLNFVTHIDERGSLTVIEKSIPFQIKRVFYIYDVDNSKRGFHKHKKTVQVVVCLSGSCDIFVDNKKNKEEKFTLNNPGIGLLLDPVDFHWMENFSKGTVLLVLASEYFDKNDYIFENS
tara:strand:- start:78 stop:443 length:366 start_codon:yes stop_codon:yes gene_type:complete